MINNFVKEVIKNGGRIKMLMLPNELCKGTGQTNPSLFIDDKIRVNLRNVQYVLAHCENNQVFETRWGPLSYIHPEKDQTLTTTNFYIELDDNLNIIRTSKVDTSKLDITPVWEFVGLEDARIVNWNNTYYLCGVRRDTKTNGEGRIELSKILITENSVKEINRYRIEPPGEYSYCEKNWMPINNLPFHFVKWTNPTEVIKVDLENLISEQVFLSDKISPLQRDIRGGSNVITLGEYNLALTHEVNLFKSELGKKDAQYYHRFIVWDKDFNIIKISKEFKFLTGMIEFACGLAIKENKIFITFGFQDNSAYILEAPINFIENFIYE